MSRSSVVSSYPAGRGRSKSCGLERGLGGLRARLALGDEASAGLLITGWPEAEAIFGLLGFGQNAGDVRWERFYPIMERLTVSHTWRRADKAVRSTFERETA
jgi:hypothetical protein